MDKIGSYPSVFAIGHNMIQDIFSGPVIVEEKIDGSNFSMGVFDGQLLCRSKGAQLVIDAPERMFELAIETAKSLKSILHPEWIYRCEYIMKPKHNTLKYSRVPAKYLAVFDIEVSEQKFLVPHKKLAEAERIGLECVPILYNGFVTDIITFNDFLNRESILGGSKIEGVVVKNYDLFTREKKVAIGKYVSEEFKETHTTEWRKSNPTQSDIVQILIDRYRTEARWRKAIQHLAEKGLLENSPRDIGMLIREIPDDILKEHRDEIKDALFAFFWDKIKRGVTVNFPEFYKQELAKRAFTETSQSDETV